ncbi:MAG: VCBS repeat-containing protein [Planctomycetota bacterium]|nr:VCBS repeat-containing protein [Planctomycetota bacterium]
MKDTLFSSVSIQLTGALVLSALVVPAALADGAFEPKIDASGVSDGASSVQAVDVDGDGDLDLAVAEEFGNRVSILFQTSPGVFSAPMAAGPALAGATQVRAGDLDGDGDMDLVAAVVGAGSVTWLENLGTGTAWTAHDLAVGVSEPRGLELADLDGDGDLDVLAAAKGDGQLLRFDNLGGGTFTEAQLAVTTIPQVGAVSSGDFDGDGFLDVIAGSASNGQLFLMTNDGLGGLGAPVQFGVISAVFDLDCFDLNGDGDLDVIGTGNNANMVAWFQGDGMGDFAARVTIGTHVLPYGLDVADLDLDGDLDVFVTSGLSDQLAWHENLGDGNFAAKQLIDSAADGARDILVADLDQDGAPDVVGALYEADKVTVYLGSGDVIAPKVSFIDGLHCVESGSVSIQGLFLEGATVTVDGEPVVLTTDTEEELRFDLQPHIPGGVTEVQVTTPGGVSSLPQVRYPALEAPATVALGETVELALHNGDEGIFVLAMSSMKYAAPAPFLAQDWYHGLELNGVWILASGVASPGTLPDSIVLEAPTAPSLAGVPLHLQALTTQVGLGYAGFTATRTVTLQ